ncbi:hypothetical protein [Neobacillus niacini]|uniref:hypothetical protein n=1 Tax=Neobacillus niacini TaxID=86668 RepID=UPI0028597DB4|nr:hypothetical protein [Neobacillus niacini]MDR6998192.1 hypothetical protein [Neobacillus niacini]
MCFFADWRLKSGLARMFCGALRPAIADSLIGMQSSLIEQVFSLVGLNFSPIEYEFSRNIHDLKLKYAGFPIKI